MLPFRTPVFLRWLYPQLKWKVETSEKIIYLTFDDGPVPGPTEFVLEILQQYTAKATFFCIGDNVRKHPKVYDAIKQGQHTIGNHTFHHMKGWKTKNEVYLNDIRACEEQLNMAQTGTRLFRPPYGQIARSQIKLLADYEIVMWDVLSQDYSKSLSGERCLRGTISATRPGSIVVFHDSVKAERNLSYALPRYLQHFMEKGFSFHAL